MSSSRSRGGRLRRLLALSADEKRILAQAWLMLPVVHLGLRVIPFRRLHRWLGAGAPIAPAEARDSHRAIESVHRVVGIAARRHLVPLTCLRRALVVQWLLRRRGIATELRFGVAKEDGQLRAHAWLEHQGRLVGERGDVPLRFAPLAPAGPAP